MTFDQWWREKKEPLVSGGLDVAKQAWNAALMVAESACRDEALRCEEEIENHGDYVRLDARVDCANALGDKIFEMMK